MPADRAAFLKNTDLYGKSGVSVDFKPVTIDKIGGSFKTNKTKVGEFTLEPGTWLLNSTAFGTDYGTILGAEISPAKDRELTGSTVKVVTVDKATTVEVFAFGYNDDAGSAGSGEIAASASVVAVLIG
ncbi:hypothetical protein [Kribbella sindirgiensis]|uniref:Head decoration protein n=1 Tax=Kribbella sindirgiensis TaxID=1124744 RepID=A0A4R0IQN0_9ACTN|nr:hypothetical protein [Kribbella sindirgiensis]TCC33756.1 hypothetical protein E0H50_17620 [Kribbella sindirgiensis]